MCSRFIEDFTNKVVEKSCCSACETKKKLCQGPNDFDYITEILCNIVQKDFYIYSTNIATYINLILSCLHNKQYERFIIFLKPLVCANNVDVLKSLAKKISNHLNCITDTKLVVYASFRDWKDLNYIYVDVENTTDTKISFKNWLIIYFNL
jgi:hypothetical protein